MKRLHACILGGGMAAGAAVAGYYVTRSRVEVAVPQPQEAVHSRPQEENVTPELRRIRVMLTDLQSTDAAQRQRGKDALALLPEEEEFRSLLQTAAGSVADSEARALIASRLEQMDGLLEISPPAVGLHVKSATLLEIVQQLSPGMSARMEANPLADESRYTLDVNRRPFWEIVVALNEQHPLGLNNNAIPSGRVGGMVGVEAARGNGNLSIYDVARTNGVPLMERAVVKGPFLMYARWRPPPPINLQVSPYVVLTMLAADPRLTVLEVEQTCTPIVDELGHHLEDPTARTPAAREPDYRTAPADFTFPMTWRLVAPGDAGKKVSMVVRARIVVAESTQEADIDDVGAKLNEAVQVGATAVTITGLTHDAPMRLGYSSRAAAGKGYVIYDLVDKNGLLLHHWKYAGAGTATVPAGSGGPYRLHLTVPQKVRELNVDFAIRDWALPQ